MVPDIFDFEYIDECDGVFCYTECTLTIPIGPYPADTEIHTISINYEEATIDFYLYEGSEAPDWEGKIHYTFEEVKRD